MHTNTQLATLAVGKTLSELEALATQSGFTVRVVVENGKNFLGICDYQPKRMNVEVSNGTVTKVFSFG